LYNNGTLRAWSEIGGAGSGAILVDLGQAGEGSFELKTTAVTPDVKWYA